MCAYVTFSSCRCFGYHCFLCSAPRHKCCSKSISFFHASECIRTPQTAFGQQKVFLSLGHEWLSDFKLSQSSVSVQQKVLAMILERDVTKADLKVYGLTTIFFSSLVKQRLMSGGRELSQDLRADGNVLWSAERAWGLIPVHPPPSRAKERAEGGARLPHSSGSSHS